MLTTRGAEIPHTSPLASLAKKELTVAPVDLASRFPKRFRVWWETDDAIVVPRFWAVDKGVELRPEWPDPTPFIRNAATYKRRSKANCFVSKSIRASRAIW